MAQHEHEHEHDHASAPGAPVWVKAFGVIAVVMLVLLIVLHLTGHAPMGHGG